MGDDIYFFNVRNKTLPFIDFAMIAYDIEKVILRNAIGMVSSSQVSTAKLNYPQEFSPTTCVIFS